MTVARENDELVIGRSPGWGRDRLHVKKLPHTARNPTMRQRKIRKLFGDNAKQAGAESEGSGEDKVRDINQRLGGMQLGIKADDLPDLPPPPERKEPPPELEECVINE